MSSDSIRRPAERRNHEDVQGSQRKQDRRRRGQCRPDGGCLQPLLPQTLQALGRSEPGGVQHPADQGAGSLHSDHRTDCSTGQSSRASPSRPLPCLGALLLRPGAARGRGHARLPPSPAYAVARRHRLSPRRRLHLDGGLSARLAGRSSGPQDRGRRRHAALPTGASPHLVRGAPAGAGALSAHGRGEPGEADRPHGRQRGWGLAAVISLSLAEAGDTQPDELALISPWSTSPTPTRISPTT